MNKKFIILLLCTPYSHASGLLLQEAVVANAGTTGAGDGVYTQTASANWSNPATMAYMADSLTTINSMLLNLSMDYYDKTTPTENGDAQTIMPSLGLFHVQRINEKMHLGLNLGVVGGSSIEYGNQWAGAAYLDKAFMSGMQFNPSFSYAITSKLSFGLGAQISYGLLEVSTSHLQTNLDTDWAYGYNFGAMYNEEVWAIGLSYRSKITHDFDVKAVSVLNGSTIPLGTELLIPTIIDLSGRYDLSKNLTLLSTIQYHKWSDYKQTPVYTNNNTQNINRYWDDVWKYSVGFDYQLTSTWSLKAGLSYESSPQDNPSLQWVDLPVGEQYRYSVGAQTEINNIRVDVFYEFADLGDIDVSRQVGNNPNDINALPDLHGNFTGKIHFIGINATF